MNIKQIEVDGTIYDVEDSTARETAQTASQTASDAQETANSADATATANATAIGTLANLETTEKTTLVGAINENVANISNIAPFARKQELLNKYNGRQNVITVPYSTSVSASEDVLSFYGKSGIVSSSDDMRLAISVTNQGVSLNAQLTISGTLPSVGSTLGGAYLLIGINQIKDLLISLGTSTAEQAELEELYDLLDVSSTGCYSAPNNTFQGQPGVECLILPYAEVRNRLSSNSVIAKQVYFNYGFVFAVVSEGIYSEYESYVANGIVAD